VKSAASSSTKIRIRTQKDIGFGYDSEASDREEDPSIEEQIILRCRPGDDAQYVKGCLERKEVPDMMIKFKGCSSLEKADVDPRRAVVRIRKNLYSAKLVDLPTIIESSKTLDRKSLYKTADICQMLILGDQISHEETILAYPSRPSDYIYPHGITPPLRLVRKRRFRKRISNRTIEQLESKLDELLKADAAAESTTYEIITPQSQSHTRDNSLAPSDYGTPLPNEDELFDEGGESEMSDEDFAGELEQMVQEADTPVPTPGDEESETDESDGEEGEGGEDVEGEKLKAQREQEIRELEETIVQKRIAVLGIVNPIVRGRVLEGLGRLEAELELKRSQLEEDEG
jgi:transcription initiation factor TFIID subunit 7